MKALKMCVTVLRGLSLSLFANELNKVTTHATVSLHQTPLFAVKIVPCQILSGLPHHNSG